MQDGAGAGNSKEEEAKHWRGDLGKFEEEWKRRSGSREFWRRLIVLVSSENV